MTSTLIEPTELEAFTAALADRMLAAAEGHTTVERVMALSHALAHVIATEHSGCEDQNQAYGASVQMLRLRLALLQRKQIADDASRLFTEMSDIPVTF